MVFAVGQKRTSVRMSWASSLLVNVDKEKSSLLWEIEPLGEDVISIDNKFRTKVVGYAEKVLLIGDPSGEQILEDPSYQLTASLEVLGYKVDRIDWFSSKLSLNQYPLWLVVIGSDKKDRKWLCPEQIINKRLSTEYETKKKLRNFLLSG